MNTLNLAYRRSKLAAIIVAVALGTYPICALGFSGRWRSKSLAVPAPPILSHVDLNSASLSVGAQVLAKQLDLVALFTRLEELRKQIELVKGEKVPLELGKICWM